MNETTPHPSDSSETPSSMPPEAEAFLQSGEEGRQFSEPLGAVTQGRLQFRHGAAHITLRVEPSMPELYRAHFTGLVPEIRVVDGTIDVRYHPSFTEWLRLAMPGKRTLGELVLNGSIPWQIDIHGGASDISGDLSQLQLRSLDVGGGASHLKLKLPRPSSVVPVEIHGGAAHIELQRPLGVGARLEVSGGAAGLTFDEQHLGAVGGKTRLATPGIEDRPHRYEFRVRGGASHITLVAG